MSQGRNGLGESPKVPTSQLATLKLSISKIKKDVWREINMTCPPGVALAVILIFLQKCL
jgi:hypothetical protein